MGRRLASTVHLPDPNTGLVAVFTAGSEVPSWAEELIDPSRFEDGESAAPETASIEGVESETTEATPAPDEPAPEPAVERPAKRADKDAWVDYAVAQGMERAEAEDKTKDELLDRYGG